MRRRRHRRVARATVLALLGAHVGCSSSAPSTATEAPPATATDTRADASARPARDWFRDDTVSAGIDFVHFNGMSGQYYLNEMMGSGAALLDVDNDGDLDLYLVQGQRLGPDPTIDETAPSGRMSHPLTDRLYRNDLEVQPDGRRVVRFTDMTDASGLVTPGYGMGVATGDIDNDGWIDLYRTVYGRNQLLRNNGDGTFADISASAGVDDPGWALSASFVDIDRDGWLDLYVGNYVDYRLEDDIPCYRVTGERDYCAPRTYAASPDRLYRNRGDGSFTDITAMAGVDTAYGPALGVVAADLNADGWADIYVANDGEPNQLWLNRQDGTFENGALLAGAAVNRGGGAEASMGVDAGDFDGDGDDDLFMTHIVSQTNTLYINDGTGLFEDRTAIVGLGAPSLAYTGFGTAWLDADNDGWLDLLVANGAVTSLEALVQANDPFPLHQRNQLFHNRGDGRFEDVTDQAGDVFARSEVSRGAAFGDVDNDGDVDVVVTNNNGPARLLLNVIGQDRSWLGLRLIGDATRGGRDMLGARVGVLRDEGPALWRRARADGSYASANDPRVVVGLGNAPSVARVRVVWPNGQVEDWTGIETDRWTTLSEGTGQPAAR